MECPFELPVRYECSIARAKGTMGAKADYVSLVILDARDKVIEQISGQCRPSTNVLTAHLQRIQENYKYIVQAINCHKKFKIACAKAYEGLCTNYLDVCDEAIKLLDELTQITKKQ